MFWEKVHASNQYRINNAHPLIFRFMTENNSAHREPRVLEMGAGTGRNIIPAKDILGPQAQTIAVDISPSAVNYLTELSAIDAAFRGNMHDCPLPSDWATHMIYWRVLHHGNQFERISAIEEARRICVVGGRIIVAVKSIDDRYFGWGEQNEHGSFVIIDQSQMPFDKVFNPNFEPHPWHFYSPEELVKAFENKGFYVNNLVSTQEPPGTFRQGDDLNTYLVITAERMNLPLVWSVNIDVAHNNLRR